MYSTGSSSKPVSTVLIAFLLLTAFHARGQASAKQSLAGIQQSAASSRDRGDSKTALQLYLRAVRMQPDWTEGWWNIGSLYYASNQYANAIAAFRKVTVLSPETGFAWSMLGLCEFEQQTYPQALLHLQTGQDLGPIPDAQLARVAGYHLALLQNKFSRFSSAAQTIQTTFGNSGIPSSAKTVLGMSLLHVPLLPSEVAPERDALIQSAGTVAALQQQGDLAGALTQFPALLQQYPQIPYLHLSYARALAAQGHLQQAILAARAEQALSPHDPSSWIEQSHWDALLHRNAGALADARHAAVIAPQSAAAHNALAEALRASGQIAAARKQESAAEHLPAAPSSPDPAILRLYAATNSTAAQAPPTTAGLPQTAMQAFAAQDYAKAASILNQWLPAHSNDGTAWTVLGLCEYSLHDYDNARLHLLRGRTLGMHGTPEAVNAALTRLASLLNLNGDFDAATDVLDPVFNTSQPISGRMQIVLGMSLLHIAKLPHQVPENSLPMLARCGQVIALQKRRQFDAAVAQLRDLTQQYPDVAFLHFAYGKAQASLAQYDSAAAEMLRETKISPQSALPWIWLARIAITQQNYAAALPYAQHAVSLDPNSAEARYMLGNAELYLGQIPAAIHDLQTAALQMPNSPEVHFALAQAYRKAHQPDKAAQERALFQSLRDASSNANNGSNTAAAPPQ